MSSGARREYFDNLAPGWDQLPAPEDRPARVRRFLERAVPPVSRRILDAGCGTGILLGGLLELCTPQTQVVELDFSLAMLRENARKFGTPRAHRVCAETATLPFPPGVFDLALCFNVLPHLGSPLAALGPLLDVLRPGGQLAIGHLMSSEQLNAFHAQLGEPVAGDRLPPAAELAALLARLGGEVECAEDRTDWYFIRCRKR